jgi:hypothetical protein|tara:strand:+ start:4105 stop:4332 length:228 start_codon:yes stop_codon:yes gene_type:complete
MFKPNRRLHQPLIDVKVLIEYTLFEDDYKSESFQEFLESIRNGDMKREMAEDGYFTKIKISYKVQENEENTTPSV